MLHQPRFGGPDEDFTKAAAFLSNRPKADTDNCVKDAVGALEAVANIVLGTDRQTLGSLVKSHLRQPDIPATLSTIIDKLWGYRSSQPGVGHGSSIPSEVPMEEAEWVLGMCGLTMIYLSKKFPTT